MASSRVMSDYLLWLQRSFRLSALGARALEVGSPHIVTGLPPASAQKADQLCSECGAEVFDLGDLRGVRVHARHVVADADGREFDGGLRLDGAHDLMLMIVEIV